MCTAMHTNACCSVKVEIYYKTWYSAVHCQAPTGYGNDLPCLECRDPRHLATAT